MQPVDDRRAAAPAAPQDCPIEHDLLSSVCHDLKEPLASIVMGAGFLRKVLPPDDASARRVIDAIHRAAERMSVRIATFSDLSKLQRHDLTLEIQPHDAVAIAQAAFEAFSSQAAERHVNTAIDVPQGNPLLVACDRERLLQVFRQLFAAAFRVLPERANLVFRLSTASDGCALFEIKATRSQGQPTRPIGKELPKPEMAIAGELVRLHSSQLAIEVDGEALSLSFALAPATI